MAEAGIVLHLDYTELDKIKTVILVKNISQMLSEIILQSQTMKKCEGKGMPISHTCAGREERVALGCCSCLHTVGHQPIATASASARSSKCAREA